MFFSKTIGFQFVISCLTYQSRSKLSFECISSAPPYSHVRHGLISIGSVVSTSAADGGRVVDGFDLPLDLLSNLERTRKSSTLD